MLNNGGSSAVPRRQTPLDMVQMQKLQALPTSTFQLFSVAVSPTIDMTKFEGIAGRKGLQVLECDRIMRDGLWI
jgi:hypothetical protein